MTMPDAVRMLIGRLLAAGHSAYAVGGCVRDSLLGHAPSDWDITTSATPDQMKACFSDLRVIETGLAHGTLTVLVDAQPYEITTFRKDGDYQDHRRPDSVRFVGELREDLARRDFTVNAMALPADGRLIDLFGGQADLRNGIIRCVGDPLRRFEEDALRILRALRFASQLEFAIEPFTAAAMREKRALLDCVSAERVFAELKRLLCGPGVLAVLDGYPDLLGQVLPEILPAVGLQQHNPHHDSDVWEHTARAVASIEPTPALRLTMLLHDLGKPQCFMQDEQNTGHFFGHAKCSERMADDVLSRLKSDNATRERVLTLIRVHDLRPEPDPKWIRRRLNQLGEQGLRDLLKVQRADTLAHSPLLREEKLSILARCEAQLEREIQARSCFSLKDLAVNGRDMMELGLSGAGIGQALNALLEQVMDERIPNERPALVEAARRFL